MQENWKHWNIEKNNETGEAESKVEESLGAIVANVEEQTTNDHAQKYVQ